MNAENSCPKCQRTLPVDGPPGLCPACLLAAGLGVPGNPHDQNLSPAPTTPSGRQSPPPAVSNLTPLFPQLEIIEILGQGGMGTVYKARQKKLDRLVALKIIRSDAAADPAFAERFNREARTLARMSHPNIVAVHDFGEVQMPSNQAGNWQPLYYFVMEFVDGANLRQLMNWQRLKSQQALTIVPQVCEALQYAHDEGVVHRDIKPENILVDHRGRVKIADFGLAKLVAGSSDDFTLTGTHQVMGTPRYMAPEQMEGSHAVDHRADIYSLGVVFYEMLTGQIPAGHFDPPSHKVDVDDRLDSIVLKAMARDPDRRFQRASDVRTEVESVGASPDMRSEKKTVDRIDVADVPHRASPQTVSEFLSYEAAAAAGWFAGTPQSAKRIPLTIRWLAPLFCVTTILALFQPWLTTYITDVHATYGPDRTVIAPITNVKAVYREFVQADIGLGAVAAVILVALLILHLITTGAEAPRRSIVILRLLLGFYVFGALLAYRYEIGQTLITVYPNPSTGELPMDRLGPVDEYGRTTVRLQNLEHVTRFTPWAIFGFASMIGLLVINAIILRSAVAAKWKTTNSARKSSTALSPFQLASRLLTAMGGVMLFVSVGGLLGALTLLWQSPSALDETRRIDPLALGILVWSVILGTFVFVAGRRIWRGEWINLSRFACVMAIIGCHPTMPVTAPLAIWCLLVLSRIRQDYDFKTGKMTLSIVDENSSLTFVPHRNAVGVIKAETVKPPTSPLGIAWKTFWDGRHAWTTMIVQTMLSLIFIVCFIMFINFHTASTVVYPKPGEAGMRSTIVQFGTPSPWFDFYQNRNGEPGFGWGIDVTASSLWIMVFGLGIYWIYWQIEKAKPDFKPTWIGSPNFILSAVGASAVIAIILGHGVLLLPEWKAAMRGDDYSELLLETQNSDVPAVLRLLDEGADPNETEPFQDSPLLTAVTKGDPAIIEALLQHGANVDIKNNYGVTPLMVASLKGDLESVKLMISKGANINQRDAITGRYTIYPRTGSINWPGEQLTPLMVAASRGHRTIVEALLDAGADPHLRDKAGKNAAELALEQQYSELHDIVMHRMKKSAAEAPQGGTE